MKRIGVDFGKMPVFMGCVATDPAHDVFHEMSWKVNESGLLAVENPPALDLVYPEQHNDPVGKLWMDHHEAFAEFVISNGRIENVLEIGAAHGLLAQLILSKHETKWTIIEPNPTVSGRTAVRIIEGWFPEDLPPNSRTWKTVVASHVLEHSLDPIRFIEDCAQVLVHCGDLFITWPDMVKMAERTDLNMLNFEHLHFLPSTTVSKILEAAGLEVMKNEEFRGHSIFIWAKKKISSVDIQLELPTEHLVELAERYRESLLETVRKFNLAISDWAGTIWLFGGHIFSQYLIASGLDVERINGILDNGLSKQGKRLYGTNFKVQSPEILRGSSNHLILMAAALYEQEIIDQLKGLDIRISKIVSSRLGEYAFD